MWHVRWQPSHITQACNKLFTINLNGCIALHNQNAFFTIVVMKRNGGPRGMVVKPFRIDLAPHFDVTICVVDAPPTRLIVGSLFHAKLRQ